jgi:hypothetical protein
MSQKSEDLNWTAAEAWILEINIHTVETQPLSLITINTTESSESVCQVTEPLTSDPAIWEIELFQGNWQSLALYKI